MAKKKEEATDLDKPFHVVGVAEGKYGFVKGFDRMEWAVKDAEERNARAMELGITVRYEVADDGGEA